MNLHERTQLHTMWKDQKNEFTLNELTKHNAICMNGSIYSKSTYQHSMKMFSMNEFNLKSPNKIQCDMKETINFHWTRLITTNLTGPEKWIYIQRA